MKPQKVNQSDVLVNQLVDLESFPINQPASTTYADLVNQARSSLALDGCVRFKQFIKAEYQSRLLTETEELEPSALFSCKEYTPYGTPPDYSFEPGHPRNNTHRTTSGNVTRDLIPDCRFSQTILTLLFLEHNFFNFF